MYIQKKKMLCQNKWDICVENMVTVLILYTYIFKFQYFTFYSLQCDFSNIILFDHKSEP